jgi:hypothetical protein
MNRYSNHSNTCSYDVIDDSSSDSIIVPEGVSGHEQV